MLSGGENAAAYSGAALHMVNHTLFKLLLFLAAGVVYMNLHTLDLNKIKGFGRNKPLFAAVFSIGALGISGVPLFSGYVSKTLLHEAVIELGTSAEIIFILTGGLTFAYMLKLVAVLFAKDGSGEEKRCMSSLSSSALILPAALIVFFGLTPNVIFSKLASLAAGVFHAGEILEETAYFSFESLEGAVISLAAGTVIYFGFIRRRTSKMGGYRDSFPAFEELCSRVCNFFIDVFCVFFLFFDRVFDAFIALLARTLFRWVSYHSHLNLGVRLAYTAGKAADHILALWDFVTGNHEKRRESFAPKFAEAELASSTAAKVISASFSFSLLAACTGITVALVYLLIRLR